MKKVYSTTLIGQAEMLQMILRSRGIESRLENEGAANYAIGTPSAAAPIVIVVDDTDAEEAARVIAAEVQKPHGSNPTTLQVQLRCACGKTLEYPQGEEPPDECPWCGRPTQFSAAPAAAHPPGPKPKIPPAAIVGALLLAIAIAIIAYRGGTGRGPLNASEESQAGWNRKLRERIEAIAPAKVPPVDADAIATPLIRDFPDEAARFSAAMDAATGIEDLAERWNRLSIELSPDWAMEHGFVDSPRLSRYSLQADRKQTLMNALALRKLRAILPSPPPLDGRLFERHLQRILLGSIIFGPGTSDPRPAFWGVMACVHVLDKPALLAERLEQVPDVVREFRKDMGSVPRLWIDVALDESTSAMLLLREIEKAGDDRLKAAVIKAREALSDFSTELRTLQNGNRTTAPRDPRWTLFLVRDMEFSDRSPREAAQLLLDEANKSFARWKASNPGARGNVKSYDPRDWSAELGRLMARAKELTLERRFAELPPGEPPLLQRTPYGSKGPPEWPRYAARSFEATLRAKLWEAPWDDGGAKECRPGLAFVNVAAETIPGRHLQALINRRDGTLLRRLYWSHSLSEGWREYCARWAVDAAAEARDEASLLEGWRFMDCWTGAVQLCHLAGTLTEDEALEMLQQGLGETPERARSLLAWSTLEPLYHLNAVVGARDIERLRDEMKSTLGAGFDLARFHTALLGYGHTPVALLREEMLRAK
ncbi:MAG TPA: DUF885 family protein [Planctomycetota bacterium]|jgi:hypothetical protein|nr:DUF885 family protein [Planctomycetota bacterium]